MPAFRFLLDMPILNHWDNVDLLRMSVQSCLTAVLRDVDGSELIAIVTGELVENAIKYGESVPAARTVTFSLEATSGEVRIRVANGSTNAHGVAELGRRVEEVRGAADKQALYLARLEQLLAEADESGKLGIYRIGFEGGFDLECDYSNEVVTMTATRKSDV